ncbi:MAG: VCBS repeat-containing protein [Clostridiales bacterium]|nr:VCBS repeat-containing protein [Clostridiales bacterium]
MESVYRKNGKRLTAVILVIVCLLSVAAGCTQKHPSYIPEASRQGYGISAAVLYNGKSNDGAWNDTLDYLEQSTIINLTACALDISEAYDLSNYSVLYLDKSIIEADDLADICASVESFTENGGSVFLDNAFYDVFDKEFIGVSKFVKVTECPADVSLPEAGEDIRELQEIIADFISLYTSYADYSALADYDYGYAAVCDTAVPVVTWKDHAIYTLNKYGKGNVFFTNPLLPNVFSLSGFSMQYRNETQKAFSNTTAGCNQLLLNAFAGYVSKQTYGYYIGRVFGSFGSTDMAWELHYEEINGIKNNSLKIFSELCREYLQVPSFSLIRNSYWWFRRAETISYYLNNSDDGKLDFSLDFNENAYSSGTHIVSGNEWLNLGSIENAGSYFADYPQYTYRAYPELCDYDSDGLTDIFCGSADGKLYYYKGKSFDGRFCVSDAAVLTDGSGKELTVPGYSSPNLIDINCDGYPDIISGSSDGSIYWFSGNGTLAFEPQGVLIDTDILGQSLPSAGDINNDGIADIAVGSNEGILIIYYGTKNSDGSVFYSDSNMGSLSLECANAGLGTWLAPEISDYSKDGRNELLIGTFDGYVALFSWMSSGSLEFGGFITTGEKNYKGNNNIKTGNNCVPVLYDINSDGSLDLVCGSLEYGLAYPIDSEYFPYADELREQMDYAAEHYYYMGAHFYTNSYSSEEREAYELKAQMDSFKKYGLETSGIGVNQHTWYTSTLSPAQSLLSAYDAGLLWNSGFAPARSAFNAPQVAAENVISLPFYLKSGGENTILLQNCSVLPYKGSDWTDISAKYGIPVCVFYHCDFVYRSDEEAIPYLKQLSDFWWENGYNFVKEDQMMTATAASYNMNVTVEGVNFAVDSPIDILVKANEISSDFPLYNKLYQNSAGAKIVFSENIDARNIATDADVWKLEGNTLYISLNKPVSVKDTLAEAENNIHIERVNIAADIKTNPDGAVISFLDNGMMQAVVSGRAETASEGWTVSERDGKTIFTKYGAADVLDISYSS